MVPEAQLKAVNDSLTSSVLAERHAVGLMEEGWQARCYRLDNGAVLKLFRELSLERVIRRWQSEVDAFATLALIETELKAHTIDCPKLHGSGRFAQTLTIEGEQYLAWITMSHVAGFGVKAPMSDFDLEGFIPVLKRIARMALALHTIPLTDTIRARLPHPQKKLNNLIAARQFLKHGINPGFFLLGQALQSDIRLLSAAKTGQVAVLLHGDLNLHNFLLGDERTGVIDWGDMHLGLPEDDLCAFAWWPRALTKLADLYEEIGGTPLDRPLLAAKAARRCMVRFLLCRFAGHDDQAALHLQPLRHYLEVAETRAANHIYRSMIDYCVKHGAAHEIIPRPQLLKPKAA